MFDPRISISNAEAAAFGDVNDLSMLSTQSAVSGLDSDVIVGRCLRCRNPFDDYSSQHRCQKCRMLVLVCDDCCRKDECACEIEGVLCELCTARAL